MDITQLTIDGKAYDKAGVIDYANELLHSEVEWKKDIGQFLLEWLNDEPFVVVYTSGSTGLPKAIELDKRDMLASAELTCRYFQLKPENSALMCLPAKYIAGKMMVVRAIHGQLNLLLRDPSDPLHDTNTGIDFAAMVPMQVEKALNTCPQQFDQIDQLIIGGAKVSQKLQDAIKQHPGKYYTTYGMTETITHVAVGDIKSESTHHFHALENVRFETGENDTLIVHAPHLTNKTHHTNDVVKLLDNQTFELLGRADHVINSGGVKLHPERIEQKLESLIDKPFFVAAIPDDKFGEQLVLIIEDRETSIGLEKIKTVLEPYKVPKQIIPVSEFVRTPTGKVQRKETLKLV